MTDIRELTSHDLPALLDLCTSALPLDTFTLPLLRARILDEPEHQPHLQLAAWNGDRLVGAMLAGVRYGGEEPSAAIRLFAVETTARRNGVATSLRREIESRVRRAGHRRLTVAQQAPVYFWPGVDVRYTPALCFLEANGYERGAEAINMDVDLLLRDWDTADAEAQLATEGYEVRRLQAGDRESFDAWMREAWNATWAYEALESMKNDPVSTWVATRDGTFHAFASYDCTAFPGGFGPTGTDESLRGKGIGTVLFHRCMQDMRALGYSKCEVCWTGPVAFYAKAADAWISRVFWSMQKDLG
ncbi:MAG: GNAT family N-acetyltransferase [Chloroflexota bacterium]|nr:GNAT family N-acetyltransferase [Chloroflexota bacterium]